MILKVYQIYQISDVCLLLNNVWNCYAIETKI